MLEKFNEGESKKHRPKLRKTRNKLERLHANLTKRLSSSKSPLKRTHWEAGSILIDGIDKSR